MHDHRILRAIFFGQKYFQTLGNKPNLSIPIFFDRFTFKFLKNRPVSFPCKKSSSERTRLHWQWVVCTLKSQRGGFVGSTTERQSRKNAREPEGEAARKIFVAPAPISSRFLCPCPPIPLSAPNQNRHATQAIQWKEVMTDTCGPEEKHSRRVLRGQ